MFCFPNSDNLLCPEKFAFSLFINYAYNNIQKNQFSWVPSCGLKWENKTYKLKRSTWITIMCRLK